MKKEEKYPAEFYKPVRTSMHLATRSSETRNKNGQEKLIETVRIGFLLGSIPTDTKLIKLFKTSFFK